MRTFIKISLFVFSMILFSACFSSKVVQDTSFETREPIQNIPIPLKMNTDLVLVFSKTNGYRHDAIEKGVETFRILGLSNNFVVSHTEDSLMFTPKNLKKYKTVVFLNTTMDVLGNDQQKAFESYIQEGGSFMGVRCCGRYGV